MPKLRHIAIATNDPKKTAEFYKKAFGSEQIGKGMDYTGVHHFGVLVDDPDKYTEQLEALGAECFMGKEKGHGKGFFEIKFKGPDGTVFDIAGHPWMGSKPLDA